MGHSCVRESVRVCVCVRVFLVGCASKWLPSPVVTAARTQLQGSPAGAAPSTSRRLRRPPRKSCPRLWGLPRARFQKSGHAHEHWQLSLGLRRLRAFRGTKAASYARLVNGKSRLAVRQNAPRTVQSTFDFDSHRCSPLSACEQRESKSARRTREVCPLRPSSPSLRPTHSIGLDCIFCPPLSRLPSHPELILSKHSRMITKSKAFSCIL